MKQSRAAGRVTVSPAPHSSEARQSSLETSGNPSRSERDSKCVARSCRRSTPETFSGLSKRVRERERVNAVSNPDRRRGLVSIYEAL